ncbi:MAG: hypothetical protein MUF06_21600 [Pirellulaceae bacterium]|nr:hypothetical protein [Pirellulaceae bacterium]
MAESVACISANCRSTRLATCSVAAQMASNVVTPTVANTMATMGTKIWRRKGQRISNLSTHGEGCSVKETQFLHHNQPLLAKADYASPAIGSP